MVDEWFYVENGKSLGPVSTDQLGRWIASAPGEPQLVWAPGMPEWVDARTLPQFTPRAPQPRDPRSVRTPAPAARPAMEAGPAAVQRGPTAERSPDATARADGEAKSLMTRVRHEFVSYLAVSSYLMVWFLAVMFYKATILRSVGVDFAPVGIAVVKALILGKFILVLEAVKLGERRVDGYIIIVQIVKKALLFTLALIVMSVLEELIVGHLHGRGAKEVLTEMAGGSLAQVFATAILMFLVLLPYLAFRRLALEVGDLPGMLFARQSASKTE